MFNLLGNEPIWNNNRPLFYSIKRIPTTCIWNIVSPKITRTNQVLIIQFVLPDKLKWAEPRYLRTSHPQTVSRILNPYSYCSIIIKARRSNLVFSWVAGDWDNSVFVAFKLLYHVLPLKIPYANRVILWPANNVFPIGHRKCRHYTVGTILVSCVDLQELSRWVITQFLHAKN